MGRIYLEDIEAGHEFETSRRTVTEADIMAFCGVSGDFNALHTDELFVQEETPFRGRIAHGLLVLAISSGLRSEADGWHTIAYLEAQRRFSAPTYPGDTIHARCRVESTRRSRSRPDTGVVTVSVEGGLPVYHGVMLRSTALLDWLPEGHRFVFTLGGGRDVYYGKRIAIAEAGVPGATVVAEDPDQAPGLDANRTPISARSDAWPAVSPDGSRIVFQASEYRPDEFPTLDVGKIEGRKEGIWLVNADGTDPRQLTTGPEFLDFLPRWSGDGELILFLRTNGEPFSPNLSPLPGESAEIWIMRADGSEAHPLLTDLQRIGSYYGLFNWESYVAWHRAD